MTTFMWRYNADVCDFVSDYDSSDAAVVDEKWIESPENPRQFLAYDKLYAYAKTQMEIDASFNYGHFRKNILNKLQNGRIQMRRVAAWEWGITR